MTILAWTMQMLFVSAVSPLCIGIIKKIKARLQNRIGAGVFQPYKDLWKLFHKDEVVSEDASWIFRYAPIVVFAVTVVAGANIPLFFSFHSDAIGDILVLVYLLSIGTFFLALAGMDTGSAFSGFGSSREMTVAALAEGGFIFSLLTIGLVNNTANLFTISRSSLFSQGEFILPVLLALCGFFIVLLAETARFPFDNPATHLELTMIHEAMILEYSGKRLALMEWAASNKLLIFIALGANVFFPFGGISGSASIAFFVSLSVLFIKILVFCTIIALLESSMAKFRFFRLPDLLIVSFILNVVAITLIH